MSGGFQRALMVYQINRYGHLILNMEHLGRTIDEINFALYVFNIEKLKLSLILMEIIQQFNSFFFFFQMMNEQSERKLVLN